MRGVWASIEGLMEWRAYQSGAAKFDSAFCVGYVVKGEEKEK